MDKNPHLFVTNFAGDSDQHVETELTLRDLFAAAALSGMLANFDLLVAAAKSADDGKFNEPEIAAAAYRHADAMLAERGRGE